jgi:hypothetical protein
MDTFPCRLLAATSLAAFVVFGFSAVATAQPEKPASIKIESTGNSGGGTRFIRGRILSSKPACKYGRHVKLVFHHINGPPKPVDAASSGADGSFRLGFRKKQNRGVTTASVVAGASSHPDAKCARAVQRLF